VEGRIGEQAENLVLCLDLTGVEIRGSGPSPALLISFIANTFRLDPLGMTVKPFDNRILAESP
jgi:hypothetical protein